MTNAAMLWTGGKDSALAFYEAGLTGCHIRCLVTFAPPKPRFAAHPIEFMKKQALALELPHYLLEVNEPFREGYEDGIRSLKETKGIDALVTGDIAEVGGQPNWIRKCSKPISMNVLTPLWGWDRLALLHQLLSKEFRVVFSCVKTPWLTEKWIGRELDHEAIEELRALRAKSGLDLCGEEGEYHTLVMDAPSFKSSIEIRSFVNRSRDSLYYMDIQELELVSKRCL